MVSLYSTHQVASNDIHVDFHVTVKSHDLRLTIDLDRMKLHGLNIVMRVTERILMLLLFFALARLVQNVLQKKTPFSSSVAILAF